jgi:hypothetical protein
LLQIQNDKLASALVSLLSCDGILN